MNGHFDLKTGCDGKRTYSRAEAKMIQKLTTIDGLHAYFCLGCHHWHVGNRHVKRQDARKIDTAKPTQHDYRKVLDDDAD